MNKFSGKECEDHKLKVLFLSTKIKLKSPLTIAPILVLTPISKT